MQRENDWPFLVKGQTVPTSERESHLINISRSATHHRVAFDAQVLKEVVVRGKS
jgi:hypothetical protein